MKYLSYSKISIFFFAFLILITFSISTLCSKLAFSKTREEIRKLYNISINYLQNNNLESAEIILKQIIEAGFDIPEVYNNLGYIHMKFKKYDEAIFELKTALKLKPDYPDALNNLGLIYIENIATLQLGLQYLKKAVELMPENPSYHDSLGLAYHKLNLFKEAEVEFQTAYLLNKAFIPAIFNLGYLYETTNQLDKAISQYKKVLSINPNHLLSNYRLFKIYSKLDDKPMMANYLYSLFKNLSSNLIDKFEREQVENEIICNLKAFIVEIAISFNVDIKKILLNDINEKQILPSEYLISYEEFSKNNLFYFFSGTDLKCPTSGKYYTTYINHVICPIHGYLPIFTDKIYEIRQLRFKYNQNICFKNQKIIELALFLYSIENSDIKIDNLNDETLNMLFKKKYLKIIPKCPDGGNYLIDQNGFIKCSIHQSQIKTNENY